MCVVDQVDTYDDMTAGVCEHDNGTTYVGMWWNTCAYVYGHMDVHEYVYAYVHDIIADCACVHVYMRDVVHITVYS